MKLYIFYSFPLNNYFRKKFYFAAYSRAEADEMALKYQDNHNADNVNDPEVEINLQFEKFLDIAPGMIHIDP